MAEKLILWQWRVRLKPGAYSAWFSTKRWKTLRWRMMEADAVAWGESNGCDMEKVEGSEEKRGGQYLGWDGPSAPMTTSPARKKEPG